VKEAVANAEGGTSSRLFRYAAERSRMPKKFFNVVVVRSIEATVEIVVEAKSAADAHEAALAHLKSKGDEYEWKSLRKDLTVWHKQEIDTPAIVDVSV
jgi:uncharacterized membrane protein YjdF